MTKIDLNESMVQTLEAHEYCGLIVAPDLDELYYQEAAETREAGFEVVEAIERYSDDWFDFMAEHGWKEAWAGGTMSVGAKYPAIKKVCSSSDCGNCS